jgi:putative ribosome biogenesis GTPase RsgA
MWPSVVVTQVCCDRVIRIQVSRHESKHLVKSMQRSAERIRIDGLAIVADHIVFVAIDPKPFSPLLADYLILLHL